MEEKLYSIYITSKATDRSNLYESSARGGGLLRKLDQDIHAPISFGGAAVNTVDYANVDDDNLAVIKAGELSAMLQIKLLLDNLAEPTEDIIVSLPPSDYVATTQTLTISIENYIMTSDIIYVNSDPTIGTDNNNGYANENFGSSIGPKRTINAALQAVAPGGTIKLNPGTFRENIIIADENIILQSLYPDDSASVSNTIIQGQNHGSVVTFNADGSLPSTINGITIQGGNSAQGAGIFAGGGSSPTIMNSKIQFNNSEQGGGGVYVSGFSTATLLNCTLNNNKSSHGNGAGIYAEPDSVVIAQNCRVNNNIANLGNGGGIFSEISSQSEFSNCIISKNYALSGNGGGIFNKSQDLVLANCIIIGNVSGSQNGGGIYHELSGNGGLKIRNCIIWNNYANLLDESEIYSSHVITLGYCLVDASRISSNVSVNVLDNITEGLDPRFVNAAQEDYHLKFGSPCIDSGSDHSFSPWYLDTDFDGNQRPVNSVDIGSYEYRDTNNNGLSDWEELQFNSSLNQLGDSDGDGLFNLYDSSPITAAYPYSYPFHASSSGSGFTFPLSAPDHSPAAQLSGLIEFGVPGDQYPQQFDGIANAWIKSLSLTPNLGYIASAVNGSEEIYATLVGELPFNYTLPLHDGLNFIAMPITTKYPAQINAILSIQTDDNGVAHDILDPSSILKKDHLYWIN